jgi:magnesium chelatase subunit D
MTKAQASLAELSDPVLVAALFALDPHGFGGVRLRGGPGPERDAWLELLEELLPKSAPFRRCPASVSDDALLGGLDLVATLQSGQPRSRPGLLTQAHDGVILFAMAERLPAASAARVTASLDQGLVFLARDGIKTRAPARFGVVLLDEGQSSDERPPTALLDRCAFAVSSSAIALGETAAAPFDRDSLQEARRRFAARPAVSDALLNALCQAAEAFGVASPRPALFAVRTASALAALDGRVAPELEDAALAARLTLAPFAKHMPASDESREDPPPNGSESPHGEDQAPYPEEQEPKDQTQGPEDALPAEILVAAIKAALPAEVLAALAQGAETRGLAPPGPGGGGARQASRRRGRPLGVRASRLRPGDRLSVIDTLRAAAPWQPMRRRLEPDRQGLLVRPSDLRIRQFKLEQGAVAILVVDASGSSAFQRLAEAKGAAELLLAQAYRTRAHVALIVFRKTDARLALPPTRSLSRARKLLADMAGGGGTPLAAGLEAGLALALQERARGRTPRLLIFTDGRPNIARDGEPGRPAAEMDALAAAAAIRKAGVSAVYIDTSARPSPDADRFARAMAGAFAALPHGDASAMLRAAERQSAG